MPWIIIAIIVYLAIGLVIDVFVMIAGYNISGEAHGFFGHIGIIIGWPLMLLWKGLSR